jgi:MYXO-CTERM domain-containing protein
MSKRLALFGATLFAALVLPAPPRAHGCSCPTHTGSVTWPKVEAQGVATDVTLIVYASIGADVRLTLKDSQGQVVDLLAVRTLESSEGCGMNDVVFFAPLKPLVPGARYQAAVSFDDPNAKVSDPVSFTTGAGPRQASPVPATERHLMGTVASDGRRLLQLFAENSASEPVLMMTRGQPASNVTGLGALATEHPAGVSLGFAPCADVELVDATGATLLHDMMCEPEKCSRSDTFGDSSCGDNAFGDPWSVWQTRPAGCGADGDAPGGCAISPARDDRAPSAIPAATLSLLAFGAWARRRRR